MISMKKRIASVVLSVAAAGSITLAGQPTAAAVEAEGTEAQSANKEILDKDVMMPYPLGGEHRMLFNLSTVCSWPSGKGNEPVRQTLAGHITDRDAYPNGNILSLNGFFPFNSVTVNWKNLDTNATGSKTVSSHGYQVNIDSVETGIGKVEATVTVTRSLLPIIMEDFPLSSAVSASHTETATLSAIDAQKCESSPG